MKCEECHQEKDDVRLIRDPYRLELFDEIAMLYLREDCEDNRRRKI
jgi:hypothetical protein